MSILQAIVLGVIQGITEFLPVSSSGHLILFPELFNWPLQDLAFDAVIHLGTLVAVLIVLRRDIKKMIHAFISNRPCAERSLAWMIIVATIPVLFVGYFAGDIIEGALRTPLVVVISLTFWAVVLGVADWFSVKKGSTSVSLSAKGQAYACRSHTTKIQDIKWWQAIVIGLAQILALIPGTSRSGITITAGLFSGIDRKTAARWSFLLSIPAIGSAGAKSLLDLSTGSATIEFAPLFVGFIMAMISGTIAIKFLLALVSRISYWPFVFYRILLAGVVLVVLVL
ncbi:MAG: undecaprenyl-diphosphate phosphatase [Candidatus Uhrbacteria bacterium]